MSTTSTSDAQTVKPAETGYASTNGIKTYYEVYGEGTPLVLLHGAYMTIGLNWGRLIPELSKNRKVIAVELQGHGHTEYSDRALSLATLASDVAGVLDHLKIDSADVAGYSFGGKVAYEFAIQNPERLRKLVIISAAYKTSGWLPEVSNAFKNMKTEFFDNTPMKTAYDAVAPDKTKWTTFLEQMFASAAAPFDLGDDNIAKIAAPVLIISGDNDGMNKMELIKTYQLLGGAGTADLGAAPKSQLAIVPGQSHVSLMMQTALLSNYINGFLK
ncbi:Pimeloyl-ACP methyl ester carboxylesterase [Chitinophaga eiseniae]|uniref:Pimeloyl-ACP methyl ester carboxylesterase n=1 Tax=Chitinophaga eiseniae TaxID=634771 RepID=A0A1T4PZ28_9BACT|nr:alpha/beta hydrolase [Chitinophaga eiseniae]SJZ96773.1 Pimeloyl-ACP methyl ester carboxylesterase [Chitinophaga eiseniae]